VSGRFSVSNRAIVGIGLLVFSGVLMASALHHVIKVGTCSSTGYSGNYGPVPYCPAGTGWWILMLVGGIFGMLIGAAVAGAAMAAMPATFVAVGIGSITVAFDHSASSGSKTFALIFGGGFLLFGGVPALFMLWGGVKRLASPRGSGGTRSRGRTQVVTTRASASPLQPTSPIESMSSNKDAAAAFGGVGPEPDAILGAYAAGPGTAPATPGPAAAPRSFSTPAAFPTTPAFSAGLAGIPGAARAAGKNDVFDRINKLAELHKAGALTDDEFAREKAKLLAEI
jgi:putative oligomerization/nucleic acid binding protein